MDSKDGCNEYRSLKVEIVTEFHKPFLDADIRRESLVTMLFVTGGALPDLKLSDPNRTEPGIGTGSGKFSIFDVRVGFRIAIRTIRKFSNVL